MKIGVLLSALAAIALLGWVAMGQELLQLSHLPPADRDGGLEGISQLERLLSDRWLGCGNTAVKQNWSEYQLARYVAGRLTGLGYPSKLAWAGDRWWVLSRVSETFWVPVVPGIPAGERAHGFPRGAILGTSPGMRPATSSANTWPRRRLWSFHPTSRRRGPSATRPSSPNPGTGCGSSAAKALTLTG